MTYKVFTDDVNEAKTLRVYMNTENRCYITCGELQGNLHYTGWITLDSDDLTELISELQFIKKQIEDNG